MPNGRVVSKERFKELEVPLLRVEGAFKCFARKLNGEYSINYHALPERRITVRRGRLYHVICSSVVTGGIDFRPGPNNAAYVLWGAAWWDVSDGRWSWHESFAYWQEMPSAKKVALELEHYWKMVSAIRKQDMTFNLNPCKKHAH